MTELSLESLYDPQVLQSQFHHPIEGTDAQFIYFPDHIGVKAGEVLIEGKPQAKPNELDERIKYASLALKISTLIWEVSTMQLEREANLLARLEWSKATAERALCDAVLRELVALKAAEACRPPESPCFDTSTCSHCADALDAHLANEEINWRGIA